MKDKKLQVFVSSTFTDMTEERQAAVEAILSSGNIPAGMELFTAGDESQMTVINRWIDESDVYLLILGGRYGCIERNSRKSYTHLEYEYALSLGKPLFSIVIKENALERKVQEKGTSVIERENVKELSVFRELVLNNVSKFYEDKKDIKIAIHETLSDFAYRKELVGWIRGNNSVNTAQLADEIARLTKENSELRSKSSNALYSSLTYDELWELLNNSKQLNDVDKNLLEFFLMNSHKLVIGTKYNELTDEFSSLVQLLVFKLVKMEKIDQNGNYIVKLTEDGHNFLLKTMAFRK